MAKEQNITQKQIKDGEGLCNKCECLDYCKQAIKEGYKNIVYDERENCIMSKK